MANLCFIALAETSEIRSYNFSNCINLQNSLDMDEDELQQIIDQYNKITREKKDTQILLEFSQIEIYLLIEELEEVE